MFTRQDGEDGPRERNPRVPPPVPPPDDTTGAVTGGGVVGGPAQPPINSGGPGTGFTPPAPVGPLEPPPIPGGGEEPPLPALPGPPPPPVDVASTDVGATEMPPQTSLPLALPGTFNQPGTPGAEPFRGTDFFSRRSVGGGQAPRLGPGVALASQHAPGALGGDPLGDLMGDNDPDEELLRLIMSGPGVRS